MKKVLVVAIFALTLLMGLGLLQESKAKNFFFEPSLGYGSDTLFPGLAVGGNADKTFSVFELFPSEQVEQGKIGYRVQANTSWRLGGFIPFNKDIEDFFFVSGGLNLVLKEKFLNKTLSVLEEKSILNVYIAPALFLGEDKEGLGLQFQIGPGKFPIKAGVLVSPGYPLWTFSFVKSF